MEFPIFRYCRVGDRQRPLSTSFAYFTHFSFQSSVHFSITLLSCSDGLDWTTICGRNTTCMKSVLFGCTWDCSWCLEIEFYQSCSHIVLMMLCHQIRQCFPLSSLSNPASLDREREICRSSLISDLMLECAALAWKTAHDFEESNQDECHSILLWILSCAFHGCSLLCVPSAHTCNKLGPTCDPCFCLPVSWRYLFSFCLSILTLLATWFHSCRSASMCREGRSLARKKNVHLNSIDFLSADDPKHDHNRRSCWSG